MTQNNRNARGRPLWQERDESYHRSALEWEIACGGTLHAVGLEGHDPKQPAAFTIVYGCPLCGTSNSVFACSGRTSWWRSQTKQKAQVECEDCGATYDFESFTKRIVPLKQEPIGVGGVEDATPNVPSPGDLPELSWDEALSEFAAFETAKGLSARTIANRAYVIRSLAAATSQSPAGVSIRHLRERLGRGISKSSMQTETDTFRAFFRFLIEDGLREDDPAAKLPTIKAPRRKPRPYSAEQIESLLSSGAYGRTRAMILLAHLQGFRAGEVAAVHGRDIDLDAGTISVVGKADKRSVLPLHPKIRELALTMPRSDWWFPARRGSEGHIHSRSVSDLMTRAKKRAGIDNARLTGHSLRHSYGTDLLRQGVDLRTVQELMRHETVATTQIYTAISFEQMKDGIERIGKVEE